MNPSLFYQCLADAMRLQALLLIYESEEVCVCDLMTALRLDQPKTSRKLKELRECDVLQGERRGKWVYYRIHPDLPGWCKEVLELTAKNNLAYLAKPRRHLKGSIAKTRACG